MRILKIIIGTLVILCFITSCGVYKRIKYNYMNSNSHGFQRHCNIVSESDTAEYRRSKISANELSFKKGDTVVSIGVGSGWREFMYSVFTDSVTFYLEDVDTSCVTCAKIRNKYLPYYSGIRGSGITNKFIPAIGTDNCINIKSNTADLIIIIGSYHHFTNDIAIVKECMRILKPHGRLYINEAVMKRKMISFKFCDWGGFYKSEKNFVKDIENVGFKCDTINRFDESSREFYFIKQ